MNLHVKFGKTIVHCTRQDIFPLYINLPGYVVSSFRDTFTLLYSLLFNLSRPSEPNRFMSDLFRKTGSLISDHMMKSVCSNMPTGKKVGFPLMRWVSAKTTSHSG